MTATRVARAGYEAPTPTTVMSAASMEEQGITNVADLLNQNPAFRSSSTPSSSTFTFDSSGGNYVNLRGLGTNRTLVLLDGNRVIPSSTTGTTDLNLIPSIALERTEVVTGGASAAYGSDAVAGVVNLILRKNFEGFQGEAQTGQSKYGDDKDNRVAFVSGTSLFGGGGHLLLSAEYEKNEGVGNQSNRPWANENVTTLGSGVPGAPTYVAPDVNFSFVAPGGVTAFGPLAGIAFSPNGQPYNFQYGNNYGSATLQSGGSNHLAYFTGTLPLEIPVTRYSGLAKLDMDITSSVKGWVELNYGHADGDHNSVPYIGTVFMTPDNAYLPASVANLITSSGAPGVVVGKIGTQDMPPYFSSSGNDTYRVVAGLQGELLAGWTWDAHYEYGSDKFTSALSNDVLDWVNANQTTNPSSQSPWSLATDAVLNNGRIVCRSSIANPGNGCVPFDILGLGNYSAAALGYVTGTSWEEETNRQYNFAANIQGDPFSTWAGKVSLAGGYEYRRDTTEGTSDALSQQDLFDVFNPHPVSGSLHVNEAYLETVVPLLSDLPFAKSVDFNGAVRHAQYELAGGATTWKTGLTYQMDSDFRIRASMSHDVRAPNLQENFTTASTGQFGPPPPGYSSVPNAALFLTNTSGNLHLVPERSNTSTFGFTYAPGWLEGFHATVDYYKIDITDAIGTLGVVQLLNGCNLDHIAADCAQIVFDPADPTHHTVELINLQPININETRTSGVDFELGYDFHALGGKFALTALGSYLHDIESTDSGNINRAGEIGGGVLSTSLFDGPHWIWDGNVHYTQGPLGLNAHMRYIGSGVLDTTAEPGGVNAGLLQYPNGQSANDVVHKVYCNFGADYTLEPGSSGMAVQLFVGVNNAFNTAPPRNIGFSYYGGGNVANYYDPIGTTIFGGARLKF